MLDLPIYIPIIFILTTFLTLLLLYIAVLKSGKADADFILWLSLGWLVVQGVATLLNFYNTNTTAFPPKFILLVLPPVLFIAYLFFSERGKHIISRLSLYDLTMISIVRIPVEFCLFWLFLEKTIPKLMTFEGRNFDILAGITAPFVAYFIIRNLSSHNPNSKIKNPRSILLAWNIVALLLLINIVVNAVLSAPFVFQKFGFEQPNIAILNFPFSWLPGFIVPVVLFSMLASIKKLL